MEAILQQLQQIRFILLFFFILIISCHHKRKQGIISESIQTKDSFLDNQLSSNQSNSNTYYFDTFRFNSMNIKLLRRSEKVNFGLVKLTLIKDTIRIFEHESHRFYPYHSFVYNSKDSSYSFDTIINIVNKTLLFANKYNNQMIYIVDSVKTKSIETDFAFCIVLKNENTIFYCSDDKMNFEFKKEVPIIGLNLINGNRMICNLPIDTIFDYEADIENKKNVLDLANYSRVLLNKLK